MESSEADSTESLHYRKEKIAVTSLLLVPNRDTGRLTCSLGAASALFDMDRDEFWNTFVTTNRIRPTRLHQFYMKDVRRLYGLVKKPNRFNQGYNR